MAVRAENNRSTRTKKRLAPSQNSNPKQRKELEHEN